MKYLIYLLSIAALPSCSQKDANSYSDITKIKAYREIPKPYRSVLPNTRVKMKQEIEQDLAQHFPEVSNIYGIGT